MKIQENIVIHMGYSKCMSTWLQELFRQHGEINYIHKSHFFQLYRNQFEKGVEYYRSLADKGDKLITVESDEHLLLPGMDYDICIHTSKLQDIELVARKIAESIENPKVIIVVRNQVDMILSRYIQFVRGGGKLDFQVYYEKTFLNGNHKIYYEYKYYELIQRLSKYMDYNNIFIINLDDFKKNGQETLKRLSGFMNIDLLKYGMPPREINVSPSYSTMKIQLLINRLFVRRKNVDDQRPICRINYYVYRIIMRTLEYIDGKIARKKGRHLFLTREQMAQIQQNYHEDNKKFGKLMGQDLSKYRFWLDNNIGD